MAQEPKINTYTRIINNSFILFNEGGERNISANHITIHLGINPGNFYYHSHDKDEIIVQLFKHYSEALLEYLNDTALPSSVEGSISYMAGTYDAMWEYRFLFSNVSTPLARSSELLGKHNNFTQAEVSSLLVNLLSRLNGLSIVRADQIAVNDLAVNMWMITKYQPDFDSSLYGRAKLTEDPKVRDIRHILSPSRPYLLLQYIEEFDRKIDATADIDNS